MPKRHLECGGKRFVDVIFPGDEGCRVSTRVFQHELNLCLFGAVVCRRGGTMLRISDLHKWFGDIHAVDGLSLDIHQGEVFGLLARVYGGVEVDFP